MTKIDVGYDIIKNIQMMMQHGSWLVNQAVKRRDAFDRESAGHL